MRGVYLIGVVTGLLLSGPAARAQIINDPTRPPPGFDNPATLDGAAARGPVLQSVKISRTEKSAIIGGETVKLGARYGDARVVSITENEVVLRSANGTEILRMYPDVEIKPVASAMPAVKPARKARGTATKTRRKHE